MKWSNEKPGPLNPEIIGCFNGNDGDDDEDSDDCDGYRDDDHNDDDTRSKWNEAMRNWKPLDPEIISCLNGIHLNYYNASGPKCFNFGHFRDDTKYDDHPG